MSWVIIYGYGGVSAFVHSFLGEMSQEEAELRLAMIRNTWPIDADRFSLHPAEKVIKSQDKEGFFQLLPKVFIPVEKPVPAKLPITPGVHNRRRVDPSHRGKKVIKESA